MRYLILCGLLGVLALGVGCNKEKIAVATYEGVGQVMAEFRLEVESMHEAGQVDDAFYVQAKEVYAKARASYILAGDLLRVSLDIQDSVKRNANLVEITTLLKEASDIIISFVSSNEVGLDKTKALINTLEGK